MEFSLAKGLLLLSSMSSLLHSTTACDSGNGDPNNPWTVQLTASNTTINDNFDATLTGSSSDNLFSVNIVNNAGSVTQGGRTTQVVVNNQIPWTSPLTLYSIIGTDSEAILMGWVYCENDSLTTLWLEDTTGAAGFTNSTVMGSCSITSSPQSVDFVTTDECVGVTPPASYPSIDGGTELSLQPGSVGSVILGNEPYSLLPFAIVDCSSCSGGGIDGGWVEVHSVMGSSTSTNVCMGIFYLPVQHTPTIALDYVNCIEENVGDQTFNATYSIPS